VAQNLGTDEMIDVTRTQDTLCETKNLSLPTPKITKTPNTDHKQEILWYLEFDGFVNKLGAGQGYGFTTRKLTMLKVIPIG